MFCPHCGAEMDQEDSTCWNCGEPNPAYKPEGAADGEWEYAGGDDLFGLEPPAAVSEPPRAAQRPYAYGGTAPAQTGKSRATRAVKAEIIILGIVCMILSFIPVFGYVPAALYFRRERKFSGYAMGMGIACFVIATLMTLLMILGMAVS